MFINAFIYGNLYAAVEYAENNHFPTLQLQHSKGALEIYQKEISSTETAVFQKLKGQKHVFLIINNEQVLTKKLPETASNESAIIKKAFPNIQISDFYYETLILENTSFISIVRKDVVDAIIRNFQKEGIQVIDFSIGNLVLKTISPYIENQHYYTSNAHVVFKDNQLDAIQKQPVIEETYVINELEISNHHLLSLAGVISYFSKIPISILEKKLQEQFFHKQVFSKGLQAGLVFFLVILLVNFFVFSYYREQVSTISGELQLSSTYKSQLNNLQQQVSQKKQLVQSVSMSNTKLSQYYDEIGKSLPASLLLTQIYYQPLKGIQKENQAIDTEKNSLLIKGVSSDDEAFTNWISRLEKEKWISNVSITEYGKGKKEHENRLFTFIITCHD